MKKTIILTALTILLNTVSGIENKDLVTRIIVSEASEICGPAERLLVASVIKNRIGNKHFSNGKLKTMRDVIIQKNAFSSYGKKNKNFYIDKKQIKNKKTAEAWAHAEKLANGKFKAIPEVVLFHDRTIETPKSWKNIKLAYTTKNFKFFTIQEKKNDKRKS